MNLTSFNNKHINTDNKKKSWLFFRDMHFFYIIKCPELLCEVLNEFLICIYNKGSHTYINRIEKDCDHVFDRIEYFNSEHLSNLRKYNREVFPYTNELCDDDYEEMIMFYNELLEYVDKTLNKKFMYRMIFNKKECRLLNKAYDKYLEHSICISPHKKICINMSYDFNIKKHKQISSFEGKTKYKINKDYNDTTVILTIENNYFFYHHFWELKLCLGANESACDIDWKMSNDDVLYMRYDYNGDWNF